jgi:hypothetical protein
VGLDVLLIVQIHPHRSAFYIVHLEEPVVAVHGHVPAEETSQVAELVVMDFRIAVALVLDLANVDIGNRLTVNHHGLLAFYFDSYAAGVFILHLIRDDNHCPRASLALDDY